MAVSMGDPVRQHRHHGKERLLSGQSSPHMSGTHWVQLIVHKQLSVLKKERQLATRYQSRRRFGAWGRVTELALDAEKGKAPKWLE
jgi:hypothetical protein